MRFLALFAVAIATLVAVVTSAVVDPLNKRASVLEVTLSEVDTAVVRAVIKNVMGTPVKLFKYGSLLDDAPVSKLKVTSAADSSVLAFQGIIRQVDHGNLPEDVFYTLEAGASYETEIDAAATYDFSTGTYRFVAEGAFAYALAGSTELVDNLVPYKSNTLELHVDAEITDNAQRAVIAPSSLAAGDGIQSSCTSDETSTIRKARENCWQRAVSTLYGGHNKALYKTLFKEKEPTNRARSVVYDVMKDIASYCSVLQNPGETFHCRDDLGYCQANTIAYTILLQGTPFKSVIVPCPLFWSLPVLDQGCKHALDQPLLLANQAAHLSARYGLGAVRDYVYGYDGAVAVSGEFARLNADSYALFAQASYNKCA